jgi:hypothetical protein
MKSIENIKYLENSLQGDISDIARLYANVFAPPPWNEAVKCNNPNDGQFKGLNTPLGSKCECGGTYLEAYPLNETIEYINNESKKLGFKIIKIITDKETVGFAWSYLTTPNNLVISKWKNYQDQENILSILKLQGIKPEDQIRYFSECGVRPNFRGIGLANQLTNLVSGRETTIYRTNCLSPMMAVANKLGFSQVMGQEVIVDRQAKTIFETGQIINFLDSENPQRTLLIKKYI